MIGRGIDVAVDLLLFGIGMALVLAPVAIVIVLAWSARWRMRLWWRGRVASWRWSRERRSPDYDPDQPF